MTVFEQFLDRFGLQGDVSPVVSRTGARSDLVQLFAALGYRRGAEIGVWAGGFSELICQANPGVSLVCVDPWMEYKAYGAEKKNNQARLDDAYQRTVAKLQPYGCEILRLTSVAAAQQIPDGSLDFVYIDANHSKAFVEQDLRAWVPKVRSGGIVSGHDYEPIRRTKWLEVKPAVDAYTHEHQIAPFYVLALDKMPSFFWMVP